MVSQRFPFSREINFNWHSFIFSTNHVYIASLCIRKRKYFNTRSIFLRVLCFLKWYRQVQKFQTLELWFKKYFKSSAPQRTECFTSVTTAATFCEPRFAAVTTKNVRANHWFSWNASSLVFSNGIHMHTKSASLCGVQKSTYKKFAVTFIPCFVIFLFDKDFRCLHFCNSREFERQS